MPENEFPNLKKLKNLAKITGVDVEAALKEVQQQTINMMLDQVKPLIEQSRQGPLPEVNMDVLTEKVVGILKPEIVKYMGDTIAKSANESELRIANKLSDSIDKLQQFVTQKVEEAKLKADGQPVDVNQIIMGVGNTLQPLIIQEVQKGCQAVMESSLKGLQAEIYRVMDEKAKETQAQQLEQGQAVQSSGGGLLGALLSNETLLTKIIDKIFPAAAPQNAFMADFGRMMSFHDLMTKIEKRTATGEDITKGLANIASPSPAIPQVQPGGETKAN
jgi:hypothetical protein